MHALRNLGDNRGLNHHIGYLGYYNPYSASLCCLDLRPAPYGQMPPSRGISLHNSLSAADDTARWEVRPGEALHNVFESTVRVIDDQQQGFTDLCDVVRSNVRRHTDGDARRAVYQQIREFGRQNRGLPACLIVVGHKVHRIVIDILEHLHRGCSHSGLGVPHSRRRVGIDTSEVALGVNQWVAHIPVLRESDKGSISCLVAVGMVVTARITDNLRTLTRLGPGPEIQIIHGNKDASLGGLEAVTDIRQSPRDNHAHCVVEVRLL